MALLNRGGQGPWALVGVQLAALLLGLVLSTIGLLISLGHLGKPLRAWRAFSQWRTSWLSREGVMSIATLLPALAVGALLWRGERSEERLVGEECVSTGRSGVAPYH